MYYITPITENPNIKEQIKAMPKRISQAEVPSINQHKHLKTKNLHSY